MEDFVQRMKKRARAIRAVREFFEARNFIEVDTPVAISAPAPEPHIEAPEVTLTLAGERHTRYLQPSPELPMKRLLAGGMNLIYQIAPVFRDGDFSPTHRPEFRLLEWYRSHSGWKTLLDDCEQLLREVSIACGNGLQLTYGDQTIDLEQPFRIITVDEAFRAHAGFSILEHLDKPALAQKLEELGIHHAESDTWNDLYHRVFLTLVEPPLLADSRPLFLTDYPSPLAALARKSPQDPRIAERFELYVGPLELANAYGELTDPQEQRSRFEHDRAMRATQGMRDYPLDEAFLTSLEALPPCAGIALGIDRLLMLMLGCPSIDHTTAIRWEHC